MGLVISKGLTLRKGWQPMDTDAAAYITAVETADGQALEEKTKIAIDNFVLGCKQDGIWDAIKASCILAGARTRLGALTPLVGTAPTSFNFVDGDYNRKTGLVGNGSTKYLDSNRNNNADPQNSQHMACCIKAAQISGVAVYMGAGSALQAGATHFGADYSFVNAFFRSRTTISTPIAGQQGATGFLGMSRAIAESFSIRVGGITSSSSIASDIPVTGNIFVYGRNASNVLNLPSNARLAFYSIGESLDLALLDARVTDLINAFGAAIP
jgi:hypothetical protein